MHLCFSSIWKNTTSVSHSIACILYNTASARWSHDPPPPRNCCLTMFAFTSNCDVHGYICCYMVYDLQWGKKKPTKKQQQQNSISAAFFFFFFSSQWQWLDTLLMPVILQVPLPCNTCASSKSLGAVHSHPLPVPLYLLLEALTIYHLLAFESLPSCLFTYHGLQGAYLVELFHNSANPTNLESSCMLVPRACGPKCSFLLFSSETVYSKNYDLSNLHFLILDEFPSY